MQNLQNIPGETDVDQPMPDDRAPSEEKRNERSDLPLPPDKIPSAPVGEPPDQNAPKQIVDGGGGKSRRYYELFYGGAAQSFLI
jgi:hypothetical protein